MVLVKGVGGNSYIRQKRLGNTGVGDTIEAGSSCAETISYPAVITFPAHI